jgi:malate synthase
VFRNQKSFLLPDRSQVTMDRDFLKAYVELLIQTCHRREIHAIGGMAAQIPIKNDAAANEAALEKVRLDKLREVKAGHDGTWVAHPGLVGIARQIFDEHMKTPNQIQLKREDVRISQADLLKVPQGNITETGLRMNVDVGLQYLESWLRGNGCVPIYNLMEDAATAEISRTQVWQWLHHGAALSDGRKVTSEMVRSTIVDVLGSLQTQLGARYDASQFPRAAQLFEQMMLSDTLSDFLTLEAYRYI